MNWKNEAVEKLEQYTAKKQSLKSIPIEIAQLASTAEGLTGARTDKIAVKASGSGREDILLSNIVKREELTLLLEQTQQWVQHVDIGLGVLNEEERLILERFYIYAERGAAERLAGDLSMDVKTVYRKKDAALRRFTIALYGCVES